MTDQYIYSQPVYGQEIHYQQGINSIFYLIKKAFQSPDIFIRHLFQLNQVISNHF